MKVIWATPASKQLAAALEYLEVRDPEAALTLDEAVRKAIGQLLSFPRSGRVGRVAGTREAVIGKYILVYEIREDELDIIYFYHGAMDYPLV